MALTASKPSVQTLRYRFAGWDDRRDVGRPAVWLKGPKKCSELGVCLRQYFAPLGGKKKKRTEKQGKISRQKKRGGEDVYGREVNKLRESWRN